MPRTTAKRGRIYIATESFAPREGGHVTAGVTRVREGHPILAQHPDWFALLDDQPVHLEWEAATQGPGEQRGDQ